jgi:hypothetical protein
MNDKPEDKVELPNPLMYQILEMNLESLENISDDNNIEHG